MQGAFENSSQTDRFVSLVMISDVFGCYLTILVTLQKVKNIAVTEVISL